MARELTFSWNSLEYRFAFEKVERDQLYGAKKRVVVDPSGEECSTAWLTLDGSALVPKGGTAQLYVDDEWNASETSDRQSVDETGQPLVLQPSTLGLATLAVEVPPERVLQARTESVYLLSPSGSPDEAELLAALKAGKIFESEYRYRDSPWTKRLFLVGNEEGLFALIADEHKAVWLEQGTKAAEFESPDDDGDPLDFSMI